MESISYIVGIRSLIPSNLKTVRHTILCKHTNWKSTHVERDWKKKLFIIYWNWFGSINEQQFWEKKVLIAILIAKCHDKNRILECVSTVHTFIHTVGWILFLNFLWIGNDIAFSISQLRIGRWQPQKKMASHDIQTEICLPYGYFVDWILCLGTAIFYFTTAKSIRFHG